MPYCMYLRKSRVDVEAELHGEGDTLARHKKSLAETASRLKLPVDTIYEEIVSGETISARPVMQRLLTEVEQNLWDGVFVMEVERLARGDTIDQGIVAQAFKYSSTRIITPSKIYDPNNEFDEEYFEFGLFMSRREYKTINRRLQRGRLASVQEGKYVGSQAPYGYVKKKLEHEKGFTLAPHPEQAEVVRMIFHLYAEGEVGKHSSCEPFGISRITRRLNQLCIQPQKNDHWSLSSVREILSNPVYIGNIRWNCRRQVKRPAGGEILKSRPKAKQEEWILTHGLHPALISESLWEKVQARLAEAGNRPLPVNRQLKNPLAGLVICAKCGHSMVRRPRPEGDILLCPDFQCDNVSAPLHLVESRVLSALRILLGDSIMTWQPSDNPPENPSDPELQEKALRRIDSELSATEKQLGQLCDLLEQGIYSVELYQTRSQALTDKMRRLRQDRLLLEQRVNREPVKECLAFPTVTHLLDLYNELPDPAAQNSMLRELLDGVSYLKTVNGRWHDTPDCFELTLFPKLRPNP